MRPSHDYVTAARDLFTILKEIGQLDLIRPSPGKTEPALDVAQALADLNIASRDLADLTREARHLPDVLIRVEMLFSPDRTLKATVERLAHRAKGAELLHAAVAYDVQPLRARGLRSSSQVNREL